MPAMVIAGERDILSPLVERILELAARPEEEDKKVLWARHNALLSTEKIPVSLTYENIPDPQWNLMFGANHRRCVSELGRYIELTLKKRIWMAENVPDDHVVWAALPVAAAHTTAHNQWGVDLAWQRTEHHLGSEAIIPPFAGEIDLARLRPAQTDVDELATAQRVEVARELVADRLSVYVLYGRPGLEPFELAARMRGLEALLVDLYDRPEAVHRMMAFITDVIVTDLGRCESRGWINCPADPSGRFQMVPTYRQIATNLPVDFAGRSPLVRDERAYLGAQSAEGLSPKMFAEFVHPYNCRIAELFSPKSVYYHGCERLDHKFSIIATLPNLGRQQVSAWSSVRRATETFQGSVVLEVTSHPNLIATGATRAEMEREMAGRVVEAEGHILDLSITDIYHIDRNDPFLLQTWAEAAQEVATR